MNHIAPKHVTVPGYDVSHYQANIHIHDTLRMAGKKFCFIKATEGSLFIDHLFREHWMAAKAAGMIVGAYNFFHPKQDPIRQAEKLVSVVGELGRNDLPHVLDWETTDGVPAFADRSEAFQFLTEVEKATNKTPIIYGGPFFLRDLILDPRFARFPLWISHYGTKAPLVPPPWDGWAFWQFTDHNELDLNLFNGSLDELKALANHQYRELKI
jgi:lysozyme